MTIRLAHLSDTHLGYERYPVRSQTGNNQRGEDIVRAFKHVVDDIIAWDPPLVIHAGDALDRPKPELRYMKAAQEQFRRLTALRPDGTRRQLVVVAGNHELPNSRKETCWLDLIVDMPGLHLATSQYRSITFDPNVLQADPALADVIVHAIPHDTLPVIDQAGVKPVAGAVNLFTSHGVATGSELFLRAKGREYPIDEHLLLDDWDYAALGHWHRQGPVTLGPVGPQQNIWYAGSTENMGFGDVRDNGETRGYLRVALDQPRRPTVTPISLPVRRMFRLPVVDGTGRTADDITEELVHNARNADLDGAVASQIVTGITMDLWTLVDIAAARQSAGRAMHYEVTAQTVNTQDSSSPAAHGSDPVEEGDPRLIEAITSHAAKTVPEALRERVVVYTTALIGAVADQTETTTDTAQTSADQTENGEAA